MPNSFIVKNSVQLMKDLQDIEINENSWIRSFDIRNIYTNIPPKDLIDIIKLSTLIEQKEKNIAYN
jgi:hypothetical protein